MSPLPNQPFLLAWPTLRTPQDLADVQRMANWNLVPWRDARGGEIVLPVSFESDVPDTRRVASVTPPRAWTQKADAILLWDSSAALGAPQYVLSKGLAIDPYNDISPTDSLNRWVGKALQNKESVRRDWEISRSRLIEFSAGRHPLIVGSGPMSDSERRAAVASQKVAIILGTALMDHSLVADLPPAIIALSDGAGQMSGLSAAREVQAHIRTQLARGAQLCVPEELGPLVRSLFAEFSAQLHAVPMGTEQDNLWTTHAAKPLANVLTTLGLPIAAVLALGLRDTSPSIAWIGVSTQSQVSQAGKSHWAQHANDPLLRRKATQVLIHEPGAVLPGDGYQQRHYAALHRMTHELKLAGISIAQAQTGEPADPPVKALTPLSHIVAALDSAERLRHGVAIMALALILGFGLVAALSGPILGWAAMGISISALLLVFATGLFLRFRVKRWQATHERRRRLLDARALELVSARLDAIEQRLDKS